MLSGCSSTNTQRLAGAGRFIGRGGFLLAGEIGVAGLMLAGAYGGVALAVSSLTDRRAFASAGIILVKPIMDRQLQRGPDVRSGTAALVGRSGVVLQEIDADSGRVKLQGEEWSARCIDEDLVIPVGAHVDVVEIDGATAVVYPREALPGPPDPNQPEQNRPEQN